MMTDVTDALLHKRTRKTTHIIKLEGTSDKILERGNHPADAKGNVNLSHGPEVTPKQNVSIFVGWR